MVEMTPKKAAVFYGMSASSLYRGLASGEIEGERRGSRWIVFVDPKTHEDRPGSIDPFEELFEPSGGEKTPPADTGADADMGRESIRKAHNRINDVIRLIGRKEEEAEKARYAIRAELEAFRRDIEARLEGMGRRRWFSRSNP